eukprot:TRINITY_DN2186_c0_g4_i2.p1 TRINITY_DN2186_c0_g4~~TRINITY_DN2186_c0_g4_i2.p1  ORF type:complete len:593 (-),score=122.09 TRINITY_DN2186_c0_g4_i2:651-2429(-)
MDREAAFAQALELLPAEERPQYVGLLGYLSEPNLRLARQSSSMAPVVLQNALLEKREADAVRARREANREADAAQAKFEADAVQAKARLNQWVAEADWPLYISLPCSAFIGKASAVDLVSNADQAHAFLLQFREEDDVTTKVLNALLQPLDSIPTAEALASILQTELLCKLPFSVSSAVECIPSVCYFSKTEILRRRLNCALVTIVEAPRFKGTKSNMIFAWDSFFSDLLQAAAEIIPELSTLRTNRNAADDSPFHKRPDRWVLLNSTLVFKGEEKAAANKLGTAISKLASKCSSWNSLFMGSLKYLVCYAAAADRLCFCYVDDRLQCKTLLGPLSLSTLHGRVQTFVAVVNIIRLIRTYAVHNLVPTNLPVLYEAIWQSPSSTITLYDDFVAKKIRIPCMHIPNAEVLVALYKCLDSVTTNEVVAARRYIRHLRSHTFFYDESELVLELTPLGVEWMPKSEVEFRQLCRGVLHALCALHSLGVAHRDVCMQNVLFDPQEKCYFLIDLEFAAPFGTGFTWGEERAYMAPEVWHAGGSRQCSAATDMYMLGSMLDECVFVAARSLAPQLLCDDPRQRLTAAEALRVLDALPPL